MSPPQAGNQLSIPAYTNSSEEGLVELQWSQNLRSRTQKYYVVRAKNKSEGDADVLLFIQQSFYQGDELSKINNAHKEGDNWIVTINNQFQYGQKNAAGENRFVVLHDESQKLYQHRFMVTTIQGKAAGWAKDLAKTFGAGDIAENVSKLGNNFVGDYLKTF